MVWIGGLRDIAHSTYDPTPPDRIAPCLGESMAYMRGQGMLVMTQSIVARLAIAHAHFDAVHPYREGNGRVGLLPPLMMAAEGQALLYLSAYIEANKPAYHDSLKAAQRLARSVAIAFMADAIGGTVYELLATCSALVQLVEGWHARRALPLLADYPVITAKRLAERLLVSAPSAHGATEVLEIFEPPLRRDAGRGGGVDCWGEV